MNKINLENFEPDKIKPDGKIHIVEGHCNIYFGGVNIGTTDRLIVRKVKLKKPTLKEKIKRIFRSKYELQSRHI
jgi:hypothetical protein